jgi:hypothetical protein
MINTVKEKRKLKTVLKYHEGGIDEDRSIQYYTCKKEYLKI